MKKNWFTVKKIFPNIWGIAEFQHTEKVISYLFVGDTVALLFDTGMGIGNILYEVKKITKHPIIVLNSHYHPDHIGGNYQFQNIMVTRNRFSLEKAKKGYTTHKIQKYYQAVQGVKPFPISEFVKNKEKILISPFIFEVVKTPGHTPDSICLYEVTKQILLTGDTLYPGPIYLFLEESNIKKYKKSLKVISIKQVKTILPGHNSFHLNPKTITKVCSGLTVKKPKTKNFKIDKRISLIFEV